MLREEGVKCSIGGRLMRGRFSRKDQFLAFGVKKSGSSFKTKPRLRAFGPSTGRHDHEYRVVWDEAAKLWNVERDDDATGLSARQQGAAIDLAIQEAKEDSGNRLDVIVCVQQDDGSFTTVWAP